MLKIPWPKEFFLGGRRDEWKKYLRGFQRFGIIPLPRSVHRLQVHGLHLCKEPETKNPFASHRPNIGRVDTAGAKGSLCAGPPQEEALPCLLLTSAAGCLTTYFEHAPASETRFKRPTFQTQLQTTKY